MSKRQLLSSTIAMSLIFGMTSYKMGGRMPENKEPSKPRPQGYEHKGKSPEKLEARKQRRKKFKAKRNAKKGIYEHKIVYKKKK